MEGKSDSKNMEVQRRMGQRETCERYCPGVAHCGVQEKNCRKSGIWRGREVRVVACPVVGGKTQD